MTDERNQRVLEHWRENPSSWLHEPCALEHQQNMVCILPSGHPMCSSKSPESSTQCCLPDDPHLHYAGHESKWKDRFRVCWATRDEDWARWGLARSDVTEPVPTPWPVNEHPSSEALEERDRDA